MQDSRPNILLLLTDQQRFDSITALGSSFQVPTPAMDRLVQEGITFRNCHCTAPISSPSRATLMTGLYPSRAGMPGNLHAPSPPLSPAVPSIGKRMRAAGYQTAYHGKWHLGGRLSDFGFEVGEECSRDETTRQLAGRFWRDRDWMEHERPFFHVVSFLDPHDIYFFDPQERGSQGEPCRWSNRHRDASEYPPVVRDKRVVWDETVWAAYHHFYGERLEKVDCDIGLLLDDLRCSGFFPNTWIIFASDHGDMAGEHCLPFKGPYMYEGVTHVPLVVVPPRTRFRGDFSRRVHVETPRAGSRESLCSLLDVVPTILDLAGVPVDEGMPGHSLLPWIREERSDPVHHVIYSEWHSPPVRMARTSEWKYVRYADGCAELFDLRCDPCETVNMAGKLEAVEAQAELSAALEQHLEEMGNPLGDLERHANCYSPPKLACSDEESQGLT